MSDEDRDPIDWLAGLEAEATPGPWETPEGLVDLEAEEARLIAAMRNALPELLAVVRATNAETHCGDHPHGACVDWCGACLAAVAEDERTQDALHALEAKLRAEMERA